MPAPHLPHACPLPAPRPPQELLDSPNIDDPANEIYRTYKYERKKYDK